jgi:hypothetical protein
MKLRILRGVAALALAGLAALPLSAAANGIAVADLDDMQTVGEARMRVLFWDVYDARLLAPHGTYREDHPFALSLTYLRRLDGEKIAERSIEEMRGQGVTDDSTLDRWLAFLTEVIPDVGVADEIIGLAAADGSTRFFRDGVLIGEIDDARFTRAFFDIWLGDRTSEPGLRDQLLGLRR